MPDFERLHRSARLHFSKPDGRPILAAEFRGEDRARWQIVRVVGVIAASIIAAAWIFGR